jgi:formylglycine-generating enzyme required for sulfatase activity
MSWNIRSFLISLLALLVLFSVGSSLGSTFTNSPLPTRANGLSSQHKSPSSFKNQYQIEFVLIPPGKFMMGSTDDEDSEKPVHSVAINQPFYLTRYEITQRQWRSAMTTTVDQQRRKLQLNPRDMPARRLAGEGDDLPMYYVSWQEAHAFIQKLNALKDGHVYRLPSEAEWEYACRGGADNAPRELGPYVWYRSNSNDTTQAVGMRRVNGFGLYDMLGNVWEWTEDSYHANYDGAPADGSVWVNSADDLHQRATRGGSFFTRNLKFLRCSARGSASEDSGDFEIGFRIVATLG